MKQILLICVCFICAFPAQSQLLKKIKNKVNKTIDKAVGTDSSAADSNSDPTVSASGTPSAARVKQDKNWCDTVKGETVQYSTVYSSTGTLDIVYGESSLGLGRDARGYRLILTEKKEGSKPEFLVLEDGKVIDRGATVKKQYVGSGVSNEFSVASGNDGRDEQMKKYIVADSTTLNVPATQANSVTIKEIDEDQMETALAIARETDDYKNMSEEEKKEFEDVMKKGVAQNNAMAGKTVSTPAQQGGSVPMITGYKLIVKGKNYGKFMVPPMLEVSADGSSVFAVGADEKGKPVLVTQLKKTALDGNEFTGMSGKIIRSNDGKKYVYLEPKQMSEKEINDLSSGGKSKMVYNALRPDGSVIQVTDHDQSGDFRLTGSGALISINKSTGEVFADNKSVGKFSMSPEYSFNSGAVLLGSSLSKIAYYDGASGSLNYLDGSAVDLGILYPTVISREGKSYLTWFRKCRNKILLAEYAF